MDVQICYNVTCLYATHIITSFSNTCVRWLDTEWDPSNAMNDLPWPITLVVFFFISYTHFTHLDQFCVVNNSNTFSACWYMLVRFIFGIKRFFVVREETWWSNVRNIVMMSTRDKFSKRFGFESLNDCHVLFVVTSKYSSVFN